MTAKNLALAFAGSGTEPTRMPPLAVERVAVVDGRMAPHEWLRRPDRTIAKSDGIAHGDDHFFPGPTDIAWDLAGTIVEWRLDASATDRFLQSYQRASGDDPRARLAAWTHAYAAFRLAFTTVGANAARGTPEAPRLARDVAAYRKIVAPAPTSAAHRFLRRE